MRYYESGMRGWQCSKASKLHIATIFLHGIYLTQPLEADFQRVYLFVAPAFYHWVDDRLREIATAVASILPEEHLDNFKMSMRHLARLPFKKKSISVSEPPYWVAYGFGEDTPKPKWMIGKLLE